MKWCRCWVSQPIAPNLAPITGTLLPQLTALCRFGPNTVVVHTCTHLLRLLYLLTRRAPLFSAQIPRCKSTVFSLYEWLFSVCLLNPINIYFWLFLFRICSNYYCAFDSQNFIDMCSKYSNRKCGFCRKSGALVIVFLTQWHVSYFPDCTLFNIVCYWFHSQYGVGERNMAVSRD